MRPCGAPALAEAVFPGREDRELRSGRQCEVDTQQS